MIQGETLKTDQEIENELVEMYRSRALHYGLQFNERKTRQQVKKSLEIQLPKNHLVICTLHKEVDEIKVKRAHFAVVHGYNLTYALSRGFAKEISE